jgi:hypothetical protein
MRGPSRESERVETPPHRAEFLFSALPCRPLPASGAREAVRTPRRFDRPRVTTHPGLAFRVFERGPMGSGWNGPSRISR